MEQPIQPIVPEGTPLPPAPVGVPPYPITPFAVWTWSTPVIPEFYWNIYSAEQRIKQICKEIGKIESYLQYLVNATNSNIIELHKRIDQLTERVAALEKHVEEEVARLDALIAQLRADLEQEIHDREQGDENLDKRITQEIHDRQDADEVLHGEISQETQDRTHADDALHDEISQEVQDRIHADDALHEEISHRLLPTDVQAGEEISITRPDPNSNTIVIASTVAHSIAELASTVSGLQAALTSETAERRADDSKLWTAVNQRIERGKILAGAGIKVVNDPDASTVTISATGGGTGGATEITGTAPITVTDGEEGEKIVGVSAATEDEAGVITEARVKELAPKIEINDNPSTAVDRVSKSIRQNICRIEYESEELSITRNISMGPITPVPSGLYDITGSGLVFKVDSKDGQPSTTGSRTLLGVKTGTGLEITSQGEVSAKPATESEAGIISEARVKELASGPSLSAEAPLKLEDGSLSLTKDPAGPVTSSAAGLSVREITPDTESESETGVVSKATIKSLAEVSVAGGAATNGGLKEYDNGGLGVSLGYGENSNQDTDYNPIGVSPNGFLMLTGGSYKLISGIEVIGLANYSDAELSALFIADASPTSDTKRAVFSLPTGYFEVRNGNGAWQKAEPGAFELFSEASRVSPYTDNKNFPIYHQLYVRFTPHGRAFYSPDTNDKDPGSSAANKITDIRVTYAVYNLYILPNKN